MDVVLIPAYEPDGELIKLTAGLAAEGFSVLVVDDGSGEAYAPVFAAAAENATVIALEHNSGKGAALKAGMRYIRDHLPACEYFVTCDADGQHRIEDCVRVRNKLHEGNKFVLTVRQRKGKIPLRSRVGNDLSRFVYALLTNRYLSDNQSGLRGFARSHLDWMVNVEKNNYDYEMNVLYYAAKMGLKITTLPIEAIYIGNNESSHFSPVQDTIRIYRSLFSLARGTFVAFAASEVLVAIVSATFGFSHLMMTLPAVGALSYLVCILFNAVYFRNIPRYDHWSTLGFTVICYFFYTLMCQLAMYAVPDIPLFLAFNVVYLIALPLRYALHKLVFIASLTKE